MLKWVACLVGIFLILGIVNPILAQEVFQPYNNPRNSTPYGPGEQSHQSYNSPRSFSFGPGIQVYQNFNKPWNSMPYSGEEGYQQYNTNPWGSTGVTPRQR